MNSISASAVLLSLQRSIRQAPDLTALRFTAVTETRRLVSYLQAILCIRGSDGKERVVAVSNVPTVDRNAPFIRFVEKLVNRSRDQEKAAFWSRSADGGDFANDWQEFLRENILYQPVFAPGGKRLGTLLLIRDHQWQEAEALLLEQMADALGHAWNALAPQKKHRDILGESKSRRILMYLALLALILVMVMPVQQSIIAPATVQPRAPIMIAAPIRGVIRDVAVRPNATVRKGDLLFSLEDAELRANYEIALRAVDMAAAELRRASQQAFGDAKGRSEVALHQTRLELRKEQAAFSEYQLSQVDVKAPQAGIAIFGDPNDWRGRPVSTGEQVMLIARPEDAELGIYIPVSDAISLEDGAEVRFFLDIDPLHAVSATLEYAAYQPEDTPDGILAYRAIARFHTDEPLPRIGLRGSAKVMGEDTPLILFLLRRPLSALRQMIGF